MTQEVLKCLMWQEGENHGEGGASESVDLLCSPSFIISCFLLGTVDYVTPGLSVPFVAEICH